MLKHIARWSSRNRSRNQANVVANQKHWRQNIMLFCCGQFVQTLAAIIFCFLIEPKRKQPLSESLYLNPFEFWDLIWGFLVHLSFFILRRSESICFLKKRALLLNFPKPVKVLHLFLTTIYWYLCSICLNLSAQPGRVQFFWLLFSKCYFGAISCSLNKTLSQSFQFWLTVWASRSFIKIWSKI